MKQIALALVVLFAFGSFALSEVPKNIFDDDWKPDVTQPVDPATQSPPVDAAAPAPAPNQNPAQGENAPGSKPETLAPSENAPAHSNRIAVPSAATQADSWKLIKTELYKDDIANAKTPALKAELARKLLAVAATTTKDPAGKYVLLTQAKELAIGSGDPPTAFQALDDLGKAYDINYPLMKLDLFTALANTVSNPADSETLIVGLNQWADGQVKSDRYDTAKRACDIALGVARKDRGGKFVNKTVVHRKQIEEIETGYTTAKTAMAALSHAPADPTLNLTVGRFYCFSKGDWAIGLPHLALCSDTRFKALAAKELAGAQDADAQLSLADSWWDAAEKETAATQKQIRHHAGALYEKAKPGLSGLALAKADKRVAQAQDLDDPQGSAAGGKTRWVLLFHGSDPAAWNTSSKDPKRFAIPVAGAPEELSF